MMGSVVRAIESLGCEVQIIPGGYTCVVQHVDDGYNKPLKCRVKRLFNLWMQDEAVGEDVFQSQHVRWWQIGL